MLARTSFRVGSIPQSIDKVIGEQDGTTRKIYFRIWLFPGHSTGFFGYRALGFPTQCEKAFPS